MLISLLKLCELPLLAASLISGLSQLDSIALRRFGWYAFIFYALTLILAIITGMLAILIIHPGHPTIKYEYYGVIEYQTLEHSMAVHRMMDIFRNLFPDNIIRATFQQFETEEVISIGGSKKRILVTETFKYVDEMNVLGMILFFIVVGLVLGKIGAPAKPLVECFLALDLVINTLARVIMWYAPIGIASLIAAKILEIKNLIKTLKMLSAYIATVVLSLSVHQFVTLPALLFYASRRNPFPFMKGLAQAAMTALGTASSSASLPIAFKCLEEAGINPIYTNFVLPVGAMVNMDGTALYEAVAAIFIAQMNGFELSIWNLITIFVTAMIASIGSAAIPSAGLVTMLIVLTAVGLPTKDVTMIIAVDWLLDRLRTAVNVMGDGFGSPIRNKLSSLPDIEEYSTYAFAKSSNVMDIEEKGVKEIPIITYANGITRICI
ncbi:sodium:dicarboxylate symporter family domain-containing protein [Ditylenchus destructor]|uniref:Amino acid transporter n=1 Tax=Ditylenchus destructor TaxID=166010 RepID=A0AAD4N589_9BILA|nr:sodium:dicarboxylate symporter family domain-containing protein [Ditylenchus destructor]